MSEPTSYVEMRDHWERELRDLQKGDRLNAWSVWVAARDAMDALHTSNGGGGGGGDDNPNEWLELGDVEEQALGDLLTASGVAFDRLASGPELLRRVAALGTALLSKTKGGGDDVRNGLADALVELEQYANGCDVAAQGQQQALSSWIELFLPLFGMDPAQLAAGTNDALEDDETSPDGDDK